MDKLFSKNAIKRFNSYECDIFITGKIYWTPFYIMIDSLKKRIVKNNSNVVFYEVGNFGIKNIEGSYIGNNYLLAMILFIKNIIKNYLRLIKLMFVYKKSTELACLGFNDISIGDIVSAEYLRNPKYGNGILKIDFRFFTILTKYVFHGVIFREAIVTIKKINNPNKIRFSFAETSFMDELRRRILIQEEINCEYQFNKYEGGMHLFELSKNFEGRLYEYVAKESINESDRINASNAMSNRLNCGSQVWTKNVTDTDISIELNPAGLSGIEKNKNVALICLHAVADDQFRCGLDCFKSIDDFHEFSINKLLEFGFSVILKAHPGVVSHIHKDKESIDKRYLTGLYEKYGLDYLEILNNNNGNIYSSKKIKNLFSLHPKLTIQNIGKFISPIVITHHGSISYEALAIGLPLLKYKHCKAREFDFSHSWESRDGYLELIKYYANFKKLPNANFANSYLDVLGRLLKRNMHKHYNDIVYELIHEHKGIFLEDVHSVSDLYRIDLKIKELYLTDMEFNIKAHKKMDALLI
jgi:hypothetical protein